MQLSNLTGSEKMSTGGWADFGEAMRVIDGATRADLIAMDGNPLDDFGLLAGQGEHLALIMKGGVIYKDNLGR